MCDRLIFVDYNSKKKHFMEADPVTRPKKIIKDEQKENSYHLSNDRNVRKSNGVRRSAIDVDSFNRFLVESQLRFVLPCSVLLWVIFLFFKH